MKENDIFKGVICYFNGYTGRQCTSHDLRRVNNDGKGIIIARIGDLEIKQLVQRNGGQYRYATLLASSLE